MTSRKQLLAGGAAAAIGAGVLAVGGLNVAAQDDDDDPTTPTTEEQRDDNEEPGGFLEDVLEDLVADGTLTQAQADAVTDALRDAFEEARPERIPFPNHFGPLGPGHIGLGVGPDWLDEAADAIGIDDDELLDALREGQTIAEVAESNGVDPQAVIDAIVASAQQRLDEAVADGDIDQDDANERLADLTERITEFVNEGFEGGPFIMELPGPDGGWIKDRWEHRSDEDGNEDETFDEEQTTDTTSPDTTAPETTSPGGN